MSQGTVTKSNAKYLAMVVEMMKMGQVSIKMIGEYVKTSDESQEFKDSIAAQFEEMYLECRRRVENEEFEGTDKEVKELVDEARRLVAEARQAKELLKKARIARDIKQGIQPPPPADEDVEEEKAQIPAKEEGSWSKVVKKSAKKAEKVAMKAAIEENHEWGCDIHEDGGVCDCRVSRDSKVPKKVEFPTLQETLPKTAKPAAKEAMIPATVAKKTSNVGKLAAMFEKKTSGSEADESEEKAVVKKAPVKKSAHVVDPERVNVYTTQQYSNYIKQGGRPCKNGFACTRSKCDFLHIEEGAMCPTTYVGEVCKNVNVRNESQRCDKIHIKRCRDNESCTRKNCTFLHGHEMVDKEAARRFKRTMDEYSEFVY